MNGRIITFAEALREAAREALASDPAVFIIGLGAPDPKGIFATTTGLADAFPGRVLDMPVAENAVTGMCIGAAMTGMRPLITHQRVDFALTAMEQIANQAGNWRYMFGGRRGLPITMRMVIGRGWGQGPQHAQSLQATFAHFPGLKVVMPATAADAGGLLLSAIAEDDPVIFLEHRWLHASTSEVPERLRPIEIGKAAIRRRGRDVTIAATSLMVLEALRAAEALAAAGVEAEVIDLRSIAPLDRDCLLESVRRTGRFVAADTGWHSFGVAAETIATVTEGAFASLIAPPARVALPDAPSPTSPALAVAYYPGAPEIENTVRRLLDMPERPDAAADESPVGRDVPGQSFTGPF